MAAYDEGLRIRTVTAKAVEFDLCDIPEMKLLGKLLNGGALTREEQDYMREAKGEPEPRQKTWDELDADDAGQPIRGEL